MGSKESYSSRKINKPFRRTNISVLYPLAFCFIVSGIHAYVNKRQIHEPVFPATVGLGLFYVLRIFWFLQEIIVYRVNSISTTINLLILPSSNSENQNDYGFWIRFVLFILGMTLIPAMDTWFESKADTLILLATIMIGINYQWHDCALLDSYRLEKPFSYSGGSAMAFSYYYGYLKLIAPGLVKRIENFQANEIKHDALIPKKKLYILIPSSSFIFDNLEGYQQCTKTKDLEIAPVVEKFDSHRQDRGLVKGRTYKNTMYVVEYSNTEYYVLFEGATPIKTFYETCKEHREFERNKREVISSFYYTLEKLIKANKEMKDVVKLIYYDDEKRDITIPILIKERILKNFLKKEKKF